jgi:vacuolar-type H+-ATPase subunit H
MAKMTQDVLNARWRDRNDERVLKMMEKRAEKAKEPFLTEKDMEAQREWDALMAKLEAEAKETAPNESERLG